MYHFNTHNYILYTVQVFVVRHLLCLLTAMYQTLNVDLWSVSWSILDVICDANCNHSFITGSLTNFLDSHDMMEFLGQLIKELFFGFQ